ncbi:MAG: hypothetical protein IKN87_04640 [Bacilli bacterium]|nr:hypothetical protein [Bacilli bacterium]
MTKEELLNIIDKFDSEAYSYKDGYETEMKYLYALGREINKSDETNLNPFYDRLVALIGMIKFKYGFESEIIASCPELYNVEGIIDSFSLDSNDIVNQYNYVLTMYNSVVSNLKNVDFLDNKYTNLSSKEGLYLEIESLKSLISNTEYRKYIDSNQISDILVDCVKLNRGLSIKKNNNKYSEIIKNIWESSISNSITNDTNFRLLFSNISGDDLVSQANRLLNRKEQSSCSMISSNFIATYGSKTRKIGFIYPNSSEIILASAYDLCSNVFGSGAINSEKGTQIATPEVLEKIGILRSTEKKEDIFSSSCYNEVTVNSKPCGIVVIGLGENDLNIDYQDTLLLSKNTNLPIYYIDTMKLKDTLSDNDKSYIAFHTLASYYGISSKDFANIYKEDKISLIYSLVDRYKETISDIFLKLKENGNLSKENMFEVLNSVIDLSLTNNQIDNEFETHKSL